MKETNQHSETGRTAVVIIHGMGNQQPMATIRDFLHNLVGSKRDIFSSPNRITDDLELRRLSVPGKNTDFFEYYWANLIDDPNAYEIISWIFKTLFFKKKSDRLKTFIPILRFLVIIFSVIVGYLIFTVLKYSLECMGLLETLIGIVVFIIIFQTIMPIIFRLILTNAFINYTGDVVRYLTPTPQNIKSRADIRKGGIELLKKLHEVTTENEHGKFVYKEVIDSDASKFRYKELIVVAHSLGSVIAYDILSHVWSDYNTLHKKFSGDSSPKQSQLEAIEKYVSENVGKENFDVEEFKALQKALLEEQKNIGNPWRVSNFITLGSPLTHISLLMTKDQLDFESRRKEREYPTCPPVLDGNSGGFSYKPIGEQIKVLHSAAGFATTQWTNMFFSNDFVGGSLKKQLGEGIKEFGNLQAKIGRIEICLFFLIHSTGIKKKNHSVKLKKYWVFKFLIKLNYEQYLHFFRCRLISNILLFCYQYVRLRYC